MSVTYFIRLIRIHQQNRIHTLCYDKSQKGLLALFRITLRLGDISLRPQVSPLCLLYIKGAAVVLLLFTLILLKEIEYTHIVLLLPPLSVSN